MADQNLVAGDAPYPEYSRIDDGFIEGNASPVSFIKGELATIDSNGFVSKLTTTKIGGLVQVRNAVTGGLAGDDTVTVALLNVGSRYLVLLPASAKKGDFVQINGSDGTAAVVVSVATADALDLGIGRIFELYLNSALVASADDLGVIDTGLI